MLPIVLAVALTIVYGPPTFYPDPVTVAEPLTGIVVADCLDSTDYRRAGRFRTVLRIEGVAPDTFSALSITHTGYFQHAGRRYLLFLAPPPAADSALRAYMGLAPARFDLIPMSSVTVAITPVDSVAVVRLARDTWRMRDASLEERRRIIDRWMRGTDVENFYALRAIGEHPGLCDEDARAEVLRALEYDAPRDREALSGIVGERPPPSLHDVVMRLSQGDDARRAQAAMLARYDPHPAARRWLVAAAQDSAWSVRLHAAEALRPDVADEKHALFEIATRRDRWDRDRETQRMTRITAWKRLAEDSVHFDWSDFGRYTTHDDRLDVALDPSRPLEVIRSMLDAPEPAVRIRAYDEIARRGDPIGLALMERRLQQDPKNHPTLRLDARAIALTLAGHRTPGAIRMLERASKTRDDDLREALLSAVTELGDPRGRKIARRWVGRSCTGINGFVREKIARALGVVGNDRDAVLMARWARECPEVRRAALVTYGRLRGAGPLVILMQELDVDRRAAGAIWSSLYESQPARAVW